MSSVNNTNTNGGDAEPSSHSSRQQASSPSTSPTRSTSVSLHAAAAVNAGLQHEGSRRSSGSLSRQVTTSTSNGRRRSQVLMNLQHNDPSLPGPGEMVHDHSRASTTSPSAGPVSTSPLMIGGDPHHNRAPSLGELHQELEAEQEAQVNRLLLQIRQQQAQILHLQQNAPNQSAIVGEESPGQVTPAHPGAQPILAGPGPGPSNVPAPNISSSGSLPRSPVFPRGSFEYGPRADFRHRSRTPSRGASPRLRSTSISQDSGEPLALGGNSNESAFYQAETQMLVRENQMLRHRIRDLEKQLSDLTPGSAASVTREPHHHSGLTRGESVSDDTRNSGAGVTPGSEMSLPIREVREE